MEQVVVSRTLQSARWDNSWITRDPEVEVRRLSKLPGRGILVLHSASVIQVLLRAELIDDLRFVVVPVMVGGGLRLLPEGLPPTEWALVTSTTLADGAIGVHYARR